MTREQLRTVSDHLRQAGEATDDDELVTRLHDQSNQFARLATADSAPDPEELARHLDTLEELRKQAALAASEHIDAAETALTAYRDRMDEI